MAQGRLLASMLLGATAALAACGTDRHHTLTEYQCPGNGAICEVLVAVDAEGTRCTPRLVDARQSTLKMPPREHNVIIRWILDRRAQAGYEFQRDGFELKAGTSPQFPASGPIMGGKGFQVVNMNTDVRRYEYNLLVHPKGSAQVCKLDPFINNVN